jgi:hypothetical protein
MCCHLMYPANTVQVTVLRDASSCCRLIELQLVYECEMTDAAVRNRLTAA